MFLKNKRPAEVVNAIMLHWVACGCYVTSTAGDSPHMNGLNEKNHHTVDRMYSMIEKDNPDLKPEEVLAYALHAKNFYRWFMDLVHISWFSASCLTFQVLLMLHLQCLGIASMEM